MGYRSQRFVVGQPFPVVFDAFVAALPFAGIRIVSTDSSRGRLECDTRAERITISTGAVDAITTEWVVDIEQKIGVRRPKHEALTLQIRQALDQYLLTYYEG